MAIRSRALVLIGLFSLLNISLPAQTEPSHVVLEPFPVVGSRLPGLATAPPPDVKVLDRDYIERSGAVELSDLLARLPQTYGGSGQGIATVPNGSPSYGNAIALFDFSGSAPPLRQTGVSSVGLRGLGAGSTLVLINGRRMPLSTQEDTASSTGAGFYDLSSIPLGLVERVEVLSSGASAIYGSDAIGGVVNVVLKRNYTGSELSIGVRGTQAGGGFERHATLNTGINRGALNLLVSVTASSRENLKASQREFSARQDLTDWGGRDHRLNVGSPAVISASSGTLNGLTDSNGNPVRFGLVPTGQDGTALAISDFTGAGGFTASYLRRFNTADYKDLIGSMEQTGASLSANYLHSETLESFAQFTWSDRRSVTANEPPATLGGGFGGAASIIPANDPANPFNQPLLVSMVHVEAPPKTQTVDVTSIRLEYGLRGTILDDWHWESAVGFSRENFDSRTRELRDSLFIAALAEGRFNAFGDPSIGPINAELYPSLMTDARIAGHSQITAFDSNLRGPLFPLPGGDALLSIGAESTRAERYRHSTDPAFGQPAEIDSARTSSAVFGELYLPLLTTQTGGGQTLNARIAARYEHTDSFTETSPSLGLNWQPLSALTFHANYTQGFRAPSLTEIEDLVRTNIDDIEDPLRNNETYDTTILRGGNQHLKAETSRTYQLGLTFTPKQVPGLTLKALSNETYYRNKLTSLAPQTIVTFENLIPQRVIRDATGRITSIDATTINFGKVYLRSVDFGLSYDWQSDSLGRWTLQADAVQQLDYRTTDRPDRPPVDTPDGQDSVSPPQWSGTASLFWGRGAWNAALFAHFLDGFDSNDSGPFLDASTSYPSWTTFDLRVGYRFSKAIWRHFGKGMQIQIGMGNIADRQPPFANTVWGYNQSLHSPLGRTYDVTLRWPF